MALAHFTRTIHYIQFISLFCSNRTKHRARGGVEQIICRFADPQDTGMKAIKNSCVFYSSNNNQQSNSFEKYRLQHIPNKQGWESISSRFPSRVDSSFRAFFSSTKRIYWCLSNERLLTFKFTKINESVLRSSEFENAALFRLRSTIRLPHAR